MIATPTNSLGASTRKLNKVTGISITAKAAKSAAPR
jgi:hypothetical protein